MLCTRLLLTLLLFAASTSVARQFPRSPANPADTRSQSESKGTATGPTKSGAQAKPRERRPSETPGERQKKTIEELKFKEALSKAEEERLRQERLQIETLLSYARSLAPEIAADALIRIAESSKVYDPKWKIELLEEAFRNASVAQQPVKKTDLHRTVADTRSNSLAAAYTLNMDRLSLQCRVILSLLPLDKATARKLFLEISDLRLEPLTCEDQLLYDVDIFYETALKVLTSTYTPLEMRRNLHVEVARRIIRRMTSPLQTLGVAHLIAALTLTPSQLALLVGEYCDAWRKIAGDNRSFSVRITEPITVAERLAQACQKKNISCAEVVDALREYLINNLTGSRCADSTLQGTARAGETDILRKVLNRLLEDLKGYACRGDSEVLSLSSADFKPGKIEGSAKYVYYWRSVKAKNISARKEQLRWKTANHLFSEEEKLDSEWQFRFSQLLTDLALWNETDEKSEEDYFHQKCLAYYSTYELAPEGKAQEKILNDMITFLNASTMLRKSPIEWFYHANRLLYLARIAEPEERERLLESLELSNNPVFYLYAEMETVLRRSR